MLAALWTCLGGFSLFVIQAPPERTLICFGLALVLASIAFGAWCARTDTPSA